MSKQFDPYHRWLGIPPDHQPPDYYRLLGVDRFEDSADVIANSADRQATHVRTFQDGPHSELARKLLADISKVKVCLLDPEKKAVYDARLQSKMSRRQGPSIVRATPLTAAQQASGQPKANDTLQAQPLEMSRAADSPPHIDTSLDRRARLGKKSLGGIAAVGCVLAVVVVLVATGFEPETLPESAEAQDSDTGDADTPTSESAANSKTDRIQGGDQEETPPSTAEGEKSTDEGPSAGASNSKPAQASEQPKPSDNDLPPDDDQKAPDPLDATSPEEEDEGSDPRTLPLTIKAAPKVSIPADAKLQPAVVDVKRVYRLTKRTPPAETATIAADILKSAGGEPRGTAIHYAMLLVARDAAVSTGNFNVALSAIGQLDAAYELDAWSLRFAALERIAKTAPRSPRLVQLVDVLVSQVEGAAADDRYRIATSLASLAAAKARQTRDKERIRAVAGVLTAVRRRRKDYDKTIAPARAALRADPNDPEANLVVGMYEVLQKGRWQQGLPMLAKCSDSSIVAAAQLDLASPDGPPQQVKVADAWYAAGKAKKSQQALLGRAHFWYRMTQGKIGGVDRIIVDRRVRETAKFAFRQRLTAGSNTLRFGITRTSASLRNTVSEFGDSGIKKKLAFSPDGATLAVNYENGVKLFDVATGREKLQLPFDDKWETKSIAYAPGGKELAVGTDDGMILIFDAVTGKRRRSFKAYNSLVRALSFSPDGKTLASCSAKRQITFWRTSNWKPRFAATDRKQDFYDLHFSPDGDAVAVGCRSGTIVVLDSKTGRGRLAFRGHSSSVNCLRYAPNGEILASGSSGGTIRLWNPKTGENLGIFEGHTRTVQGLAFSPDSRIIASVSKDHTLKLWDTAGTLLETLDGHASGGSGNNRGARGAIAFSPEGRYLASCGNATLKFWVPAQP